MARKSYANIVNPMEVSIGIERLLVGEYPQSWSPARINLDSLPTGFYDLGAVVEDSPSLKITRESYELKTGVPMVTQFQAVTGVEGSFECQLHSYHWRKLQYALGNYTAASSYTAIGTVSSVNAANAYTFSSTTAVQSLAVGMTVVFASTGSKLDNPDAFESRVTSLTAGGLVYLDPPPTSATSIGTGWVAATYDYVVQVYGSSVLRKVTLLGVIDLIDGTQIVHRIIKAQAQGDITEEVRPDQNMRVPLNFKAFGVETTINSLIQLVVAERYQFPKIS